MFYEFLLDDGSGLTNEGCRVDRRVLSLLWQMLCVLVEFKTIKEEQMPQSHGVWL